MRLSVVTTLYCSAPYLEEFYTRVSASAAKITNDFEIIFVNDGSPDNSLELARALFQKDERVSVIDLSRNFGHHKALMTGLAHARGDSIFLIDSDLEENPELLETFFREMQIRNADVVYGVQHKRKGNLFERVSGAIFFKVFNALSTQEIPTNVVTARIMTARYVNALLRHQEREVVIAGLWSLVGFRQVSQPITKHRRAATTYGFRKKVSHLVNAVTSFSNKPLVFIFYLGCFILLVSSIAALDLIVRRLFFGTLMQGWPSLIVSIWLLGGLTIFCLGLIGIYMSKIFIEVKQRPTTIIREVYQHQSFEKPDRLVADYEEIGRLQKSL